MKPVHLQDAAFLDLAEADHWYESKLPGLGDDLLNEFRATSAKIAERPRSYREVEGGARRALLRRFPYMIIFVEEDTTIEVIAVMHTHRNPDVWKSRLRPR
ncbi:MAG: type II toxin-antitoxin system RelE/ParE family toxin [Planctomycetota bacterium]|nr:type II toxin-antitoxin system RelE/ParE family toxin [Planctomycetota bacterium]